MQESLNNLKPENKYQINIEDIIKEVSEISHEDDLERKTKLKINSTFQLLSSRRQSLIQEETKQQLNESFNDQVTQCFDYTYIQNLLIHSKDNIKIKDILLQNIEEIIQQLLVQYYMEIKYAETFTNILQTLVVFYQQCAQLIEIISSQNRKNLIDINAKYDVLDFFFIQAKSIDDINIPIVEQTLIQINKNYLQEILFLSSNFQKEQNTNQQQQILNDLKILHSKLNSCIEVFNWAAIFDKKDLFSIDRNAEVWQKLMQFAQIKQLAPQKEINENLKSIVKRVMLVQAILSKTWEQDTTLKKVVYLNLGAIYYLFQTNSAYKKAEVFISNPRPSAVVKITNLMEQGIIKNMMSLTFPMIKFNKKIYIYPVIKPITMQQLQHEYQLNLINKKNIFPINLTLKKNYLNTNSYTNIFLKSENKIKIRILCSQQLQCHDNFNEDKKKIQRDRFDLVSKYFSTICCCNNSKVQTFNSIIIQVHGGGFIGMSSRSHQTYSRRWANKLNVPIFSIDYKLAPQYPYPQALDDCWQAYYWIINYVQTIFNINPQKVILVGDSAGGNLISALTLRCIKEGVRIPDGLVLIYPALNLNSCNYTPSLFYSLDDKILPHTILKICINSYIPKEIEANPIIDPYLSPSLASKELLQEFPPTRILCGSKDPLHDECWRFLKKLLDLGKNAKMIIYNDLPHGFLNYDVPQGLKVARLCVDEAADTLNELLNL